MRGVTSLFAIYGLGGLFIEIAQFAVPVPVRVAIAHDRTAIESGDLVIADRPRTFCLTFGWCVIAILLVRKAEDVAEFMRRDSVDAEIALLHAIPAPVSKLEIQNQAGRVAVEVISERLSVRLFVRNSNVNARCFIAASSVPSSEANGGVCHPSLFNGPLYKRTLIDFIVGRTLPTHADWHLCPLRTA